MTNRFGVVIAVAGALAAAPGCSSDDDSAGDERTTLTVMSFNIWGGGGNEDKPIDETVAAIQAVNPDIVGIQETMLEGPDCTAKHCPPQGESVAAELAGALGYEYYEQRQVNEALWANAILSRHPIGEPTPNDLGVEIEVEGQQVYAFNIHLDDSPYQPYQLLDIPYGGAPFIDTEAEAIRFAERTRGPAIELLKEDLPEADAAAAAFVFGDFNEPSGLDWTQAAVDAGNQPIVVDWPTTRALEDEGFVDAFRNANPDPAAKPAFTWTPSSKPTVSWDHHDRIDFVLARGDDLEVESAAIVGEQRPEADIVVRPWPSDHRAVAATVTY
jgi:endonuclease/exonuclease/phosphatase family metal-dependent hydrolase